MEESFYWIQYNGLLQIALFLGGNVEETDSCENKLNFWLITGGNEIDNCESIKVINGPMDIFV